MPKRLLLVISAATALLAALPLTAASAGTIDVLTVSKVGGPNVKVGAVLKSGLKTGTKATFFSPGTTMGVICGKAAQTGKVTKNPPKPGTATGSLTAQSFSSCTSNVPGVTSVKSVTVLNLPYSVTVSDAAGFPVTVSKSTKLSTKIVVNTVIGTIACTFSAAKIAGNASNTGNVVTFKNQVFTKSAGPSQCPAKGSFSATFGPVIDSSVTGSPHVFVN